MESRSCKMEADAHPKPMAICIRNSQMEEICMLGMCMMELRHYVYCRP